MVIMAVMGAILIAIAIAAKMTDVGIDAQKLNDYVSARENNYQIARSAVEMGYVLLNSDTGDTDSLTEAWAAGSVSLDWQGTHVTVSIVDEESKFPLSAMQQTPDKCEYLQKALVRLFENGGLRSGQEAVDHFLDWVDTDSTRRSYGAENGDYEDKVIKDSPVDSLDEILDLPGWIERPKYISTRPQNALQAVVGGSVSATGSGTNPNASDIGQQSTAGNSGDSGPTYKLEALGSQTQGEEATTPWSEWVTVHSNGKININTAPKEVLLCLDESMTKTIVDEIDSKRHSGAFKEVDALYNVTGMDADLLFRIQDYLCVKSEIFSVDAVVQAYPGQVTLHTVVDRSQGNVKILRWEVK
ncbi:MAG: general secretion pathway protein GspK [bacterium]|nr:general secretion pathway protein GspK [bacterium]